MMPEVIELTRLRNEMRNGISDKVKELIPDGNLSACLTCGTCTSGCPATGLMDMYPRKFLRMAVFGQDRELERHPWVWVCTMCNRCYDACPMKLNIPHKFEFRSIVEYYARWIREGKLPVTSHWNRTGIKFTVQDPCNVVRKSLGDRFADDLRYVVKQVVGEDNFVEMAPNKSNNFCCGTGGGCCGS